MLSLYIHIFLVCSGASFVDFAFWQSAAAIQYVILCVTGLGSVWEQDDMTWVHPRWPPSATLTSQGNKIKVGFPPPPPFYVYLLACFITLLISNTTCYLQLVFTMIVPFLFCFILRSPVLLLCSWCFIPFHVLASLILSIFFVNFANAL
jgi:hypothetical protein